MFVHGRGVRKVGGKPPWETNSTQDAIYTVYYNIIMWNSELGLQLLKSEAEQTKTKKVYTKSKQNPSYRLKQEPKESKPKESTVQKTNRFGIRSQ